MLFVFSPCLIIVVGGSETYETKVCLWRSRQLSDPRNVCRRSDIVPVVLGQMRKRLISLADEAPFFRALCLAVAYRGSMTAFSAANFLIMKLLVWVRLRRV